MAGSTGRSFRLMRRAVSPIHITLAIVVATISLFGPAPAAWGQLIPRDPPPFVATPDNLVQQMLYLGRVTSGDVVYDLGSGDGRLVIAAAQIGARGVGIEYDAALVARSWARADSAGVRARVSFHHQDIFTTDVRDADVVMLYLNPEFNLRLRPTLLEQLSPGDRVVSHAFNMGDWEPDSTLTLGSGVERATLYSWIIPADVDGFWVLEIDGAEDLNLELRQRFQRLTGTAWNTGAGSSVESGSIRGSEIRFELASQEGRAPGGRLVFVGSIAAGRMSGSVTGLPGSAVRTWRALRFSDPARLESSAAHDRGTGDPSNLSDRTRSSR